MASNWIRLDTKSMLAGWTAELPGEQYAAWIKFLLAIKTIGTRDGHVQKSYFTDEYLDRHHLSRNAFSEMIRKAKVANGDGPAVDEDLLDYIVKSWSLYQLDPTAKDRKKKQRENPVTDVTVSHGCHEDGTGRDTTGRDNPPLPPFERFWNAWPEHSRKTSKRKCQATWKRDKLDRMADHVIGVVEAMKQSQKWTDQGGRFICAPLVWLNGQRWDCDLEKLKAAVAKERRHEVGRGTAKATRSTPPPSDFSEVTDPEVNL